MNGQSQSGVSYFQTQRADCQQSSIKLDSRENGAEKNVSKDHLHKLFKKATGQTPIQFLKSLRLEKAKHLLETTNLRVREILIEVGISDQTHFVRDFKKLTGLTPNEYRQEESNKEQAEKGKNNVNAVNC